MNRMNTARSIAEQHRSRPWILLGANAAMFYLVSLGAATEMALLLLRHENIYQFGWLWSLQSSMAVAWLWLTAGWLWWFTARILMRLLRSYPAWWRGTIWAAALGTSALGAAAYLS